MLDVRPCDSPLPVSTVFNSHFLVVVCDGQVILANQMEKLQDLSQSELQELLDNTERVESMALESDEVKEKTPKPLSLRPQRQPQNQCVAYSCYQLSVYK